MTDVEVNYTYHAQLDRVIDGDTVVLIVDNGFHNREHHSIRLLDVDTPEIYRGTDIEKEAGQQAKMELESWLTESAECYPDKSFSLILVTQKDRQTFNRYIGDIYCRGCGDSLNKFMRELGY